MKNHKDCIEIFTKFIDTHYSHASQNYRDELKKSFIEFIKTNYETEKHTTSKTTH